jgi:predicted RecA/RadA family phage recombinase
MKNFVQEGDIITVAAPYAVTSGQGVLVGSLFGVAAFDAANGANVEIMPEGVFDITALTADTGTQGTKMYWDNTNRRLTITASGNTLVGALTVAKGGADTTARVYLDGVIR